MSPGQRCDEIIRLIEEALGATTSADPVVGRGPARAPGAPWSVPPRSHRAGGRRP